MPLMKQHENNKHKMQLNMHLQEKLRYGSAVPIYEYECSLLIIEGAM